MNKVYFAWVDEDYGGVYIAAPNIKEAKKMARNHEIICDYLEKYTDLKIQLCRKDGRKSAAVEIDHEGELDIDQIIAVGKAWWSCSKCGGGNLKANNGAMDYTCLDCGHTEEIPYLP